MTDKPEEPKPEQDAPAQEASPSKATPKAAEAKPAAAAKSPPKAPPKAAAKDSELSRRGFFSWAAVAWVGFSAAIGGCLTAWGRFMFPNVLYEPPTSFKVGPPSEFPTDSVDERFMESNGVWIVNESDQIYAIIAICTHLGCPPALLEAHNKYKCPCHGSGYYRNGINFEGPTPRPLERAAIAVDPDDGQILVDKAQKFLWERGQWDDPAAFLDMT
jgi:cytochrome b6-f complex iron-sulfur subunit